MAENIENSGCSQIDSAEHEGYVKASRSFNRIWKERDSAQPKLLEAILYKDNFNRAYKRVKANKGAPGIDGMTTTEALPYLKEHQQELHNGNKHTIRDSVNYLAGVGCQNLKIVPICNVGAWYENGYGKSISLEELFDCYLEYIPQYLEHGLKYCLTESSYIDLVTKKASDVIKHNERCRDCEYATRCCGGCRAAALEYYPNDIMAIDESSCLFMKAGYIDKIEEAVRRVSPTVVLKNASAFK